MTPRLDRLGSNFFPLQSFALQVLIDALYDSHLTIVVGGAKQGSLRLLIRVSLSPEPKLFAPPRPSHRPMIQSCCFHCDLAANNFEPESVNSETGLPQNHVPVRLNSMRLNSELLFHPRITMPGSLRSDRL